MCNTSIIMIGLKVIVQSAFLMVGFSSEINGDIMPMPPTNRPMVGGQRDPNNCLIGAGYTWCESSQSCIRQWVTPCEDHFTDCTDCSNRQKNGENIACPQECDLINLDCNTDKDCDTNHFCRVSSLDIDGPKQCVPYSNEGESCGGYTLPANQMRCSPNLECANTMGPMIADAPGNCMRPCKSGHTRDSYGNCNQLRGGLVEPGPVILGGTGPLCNPCPPRSLRPCPAPAPGCNYTPSIPDECGCIVGCGEINCAIIDPFEPMPPMPRPTDPLPYPLDPTLDPTPICPDVMCMMYCANDFQKDANGCDMCICNEIHNPECPIPYSDCNEKVCPKVTEMTQCSDGGIPDYTTYQLSLIIKDKNIKNIFALFGSDVDRHLMIIPGAYQIKNVFGSNIGGVSASLTAVNQASNYDSWLTIGVTEGDPNNILGTVGIDFESWSIDSPLSIGDGAVFLMNPSEVTINTGELIIGQLTIPSSRYEEASINVQGKLKDGSSWIQYDIVFTLNPPLIIDANTVVPNNCEVWFDGCNTCQTNNGVLGACTRIMCFREETPYCLRPVPGH
jgi:hypothetical protein